MPPSYRLGSGCHAARKVVDLETSKAPCNGRSPTAPVQNVCVDHCRFDVFVAEQLLNDSDVVPVLEQNRGLAHQS